MTALFAASILFLSVASVTAQEEAAGEATQAPQAPKAPKAPQLAVGGKVPSIQLEGVQWLKGEPVTSLSGEGKLYMIECWATWCGPCIASIPHINDLHKKYGDQGLVVIGMNVWEDGIDKIRKFVKEQGAGMAYRVAYSGGRGSAFEEKWLRAAGVSGIPNAFLVKDGKLLLNTHPASVDGAMVESMLASDFDAAAFAAKKKAEEARLREIQTRLTPLIREEKWAEVKAFAEQELTENEAEIRDNILGMVAVRTGDWAAIQSMGDAMEDKAQKENHYGQVAFTVPDGAGAAVAAEAALAVFSEEMVANQDSEQGRLMAGLVRLRYLSLSGDLEGARARIESLRAMELEDGQMKAFIETLTGNASANLDAGQKVAPLNDLMQ